MVVTNANAAGRADLHTHSTASDGMGTPADIVRLAREAGLAAVALTDHDTTAGIGEALEAGRRLGVEVVPGVELSTAYDGTDVHVLGYFIDWENGKWQERLSAQRGARIRRNAMIVERLNALGMRIGMDDVMQAAGGEDHAVSISRAHIAWALVERGYAATTAEAFDRYLGRNGSAYVRLDRITPQEAIGWIHDAGGAAVIAHPGLYGRDELVEELLRSGADGIEARHSDHTPEDEKRYAAMAADCGVIATGGSDYHGARGGTVFHGPLGGRTVDAAVVRQLEAAAGRYR